MKIRLRKKWFSRKVVAQVYLPPLKYRGGRVQKEKVLREFTSESAALAFVEDENRKLEFETVCKSFHHFGGTPAKLRELIKESQRTGTKNE